MTLLLGQPWVRAVWTIFSSAKSAQRYLLVIQIIVCVLSPQADADSTGIINYKPSTFTEQPTSPFFFSIGRELKFGSVIGETAPTVFVGDLTEVYPSPDQAKAAIVSKGNLYLVEAGKPTIRLLKGVDNEIGRRLGDTFYKSPMLQWDADSRNVYIVRDKKQDLGTAQMFSREATLVRINVSEPAVITDVIRDFRSASYFLVGEDAICFNYALDNGDVVWKCARKGITTDAMAIEGARIFLDDDDSTSIEGKPFLSYHPNIYETEIWLTLYGFSLQRSPDGHTGFFSKDRPGKPIFVVKGGYNIKGMYVDGILQRRGVVLPGGRYALLDVAYTSFRAQLLVDGLTGQYRELPPDSRVYRNLNTSSYGNVKIGFRGTDSSEFLPTAHLRTNVPSLSR